MAENFKNRLVRLCRSWVAMTVLLVMLGVAFRAFQILPLILLDGPIDVAWDFWQGWYTATFYDGGAWYYSKSYDSAQRTLALTPYVLAIAYLVVRFHTFVIERFFASLQPAPVAGGAGGQSAEKAPSPEPWYRRRLRPAWLWYALELGGFWAMILIMMEAYDVTVPVRDLAANFELWGDTLSLMFEDRVDFVRHMGFGAAVALVAVSVVLARVQVALMARLKSGGGRIIIFACALAWLMTCKLLTREMKYIILAFIDVVCVAWALEIYLPRRGGGTAPISFVPLSLLYSIIALSQLFHFGFMVPAPLILAHFFTRRRPAAYLWPTRLPRLKRAARGMTLIELLIVIAIIAITVAGASHVVSAASISQRRMRDWNEAVRIGETQIEIFKGEGAPSEPGIYPIDARLMERYPLAANAEIEVRPATAGLREVRVRTTIRNESDDRVVTLTALIPVRKAKEAPGA